MSPASPKLQRFVWGGMALTLVIVVVGFVLSLRRPRPAASAAELPVLFQVPDFHLTNQLGQVVSREDLQGQVWLADIIFTSCAGPCPEMTQRMAGLQAAVPREQVVRFVTLTTHPEFDTPPVLAAYGKRFGADPHRWHFLTGPKKQIAALAIQGLKLTTIEKGEAERENPQDLFIHSTLFVLVDQKGRARAVFESDQPELQPKVMQAIASLLDKG